ncbi:MAG TPA: hypothetical protein VM557_12015 [Thermoanaerobaculia bacterium]|nr:hypothetical protein [Thermoanaerobaculia bacterium]
MKSRGPILLAFTLAIILTGCRTSEFGTLVRAVESEAGVRRQSIPFLGLARTGVRMIHPKGVRDFRLAVFETGNVEVSERVDRAIASIAGRGWSPLVRVTGRNGERTAIWMRSSLQGEGIEMIVFSHDASESVIIQLEMDPEAVMRGLIEEPAALAGTARAVGSSR